ncbi:MAG: AraC family transcriptional regulator [Myxococcota bacterium]
MTTHELNPRLRLASLEPGRHHGAASMTGIWVMVGRQLPEAFEWSSVPPAASLSLVWGEGGCHLSHAGGELTIGSGEWMWIDSGYAHRGRGDADSDFLTLFVPDELVTDAGLDLAPIGASAQPAPADLATTLMMLAVLVLDGRADGFDRPALDALLDHVSTVFDALPPQEQVGEAVQKVRRWLEANFVEETSLGALAKDVGLSPAELSKRFYATWGVTPVQYRKQLRLKAATRELAAGRSITAAARNAGFSDTAHLSRTFQRQYGLSPSAWQQQISRYAPKLVT